MKTYFNPIGKKMEGLFESLNPVFTVKYENSPIENKSGTVYITLEAENEEQAKDKAMVNPEFIQYIQMESFDRENLNAYKPVGLYVIGRVEYFEEKGTRA